jgi:hypothetical protein
MIRKWNVGLMAACLFVAFVAVVPAIAQAPRVIHDGDRNADGNSVSVFYQSHYLRPGMVEILAKQKCGGDFYRGCKVSFGSDGFVEFTAPRATQEAFAALLEEKDVPAPTQIFQIYLLQADNQERGMPDELPSHALNALMDLTQLLPFKGYSVVDSGFMRTSGEARIFMGETRRYAASLRFEGDPTAGKPLRIEFHLRAEDPQKDGTGQVTGIRSIELLDTTFSMTTGETVVVGTSKLNGGGEALVVLLSAKS